MGTFFRQLKEVLFFLNDTLAAVHFLLRFRQPRQGLTILCYHRVVSDLPQNSPYNAFNVEPKIFAEQLETLFQMKGVTVVSLPTVLGWLEHGAPRRGAYVLFTFDDGWQHGLKVAELLADKQVSAVFFPVTDYIGKPVFDFFNYDVWCHALEDANPEWFTPLTLEGCQKLRALGMSLESQGHRHIPLGLVPENEMKRDVEMSLAYFHTVFGAKPRAFCYPYGSSRLLAATPTVAAELHRQGIQLAVTTDAGSNKLQHLKAEALRQKRIPIHTTDRGLFFEAKVAGYHAVLPWLKMAAHSMKRMFNVGMHHDRVPQ